MLIIKPCTDEQFSLVTFLDEFICSWTSFTSFDMGYASQWPIEESLHENIIARCIAPVFAEQAPGGYLPEQSACVVSQQQDEAVFEDLYSGY